MDQKRRLLINGEKKEYPSGTVYRRIAEEYQKEYPHPIVLVSADGRLRELHHTAEEGAAVEFVTLSDKAGFEAYRRSMTLLLLKAIYHVAGDNSRIERVGIHFAVGGRVLLYNAGGGSSESDFSGSGKGLYERDGGEGSSHREICCGYVRGHKEIQGIQNVR